MLSGKQGILPIQDLRDAITQGAIASPGDPIPQANLQPASLDLRLGGIAHRLRCSFLPQGRSVSDRLEEIAMDSIYLDQEGTVLEVNRPYLIPLTETLNLPPDIRARANPRSSTMGGNLQHRLPRRRGERQNNNRTSHKRDGRKAMNEKRLECRTPNRLNLLAQR